ncbi:MAG TPA: UbiX family flavin prenyltransferase [Verrucomicrobiae bacterium]|jgi:4-hydroxy-3-polyprenylbenzoate decarboxylase|nr:UbiX family flavin prenyltransferase [Verrucomicrobiae bacterium]
MRRLIIGISGATGAIYGVRMLEVLSRVKDIETHLVMSRAAKMTIQVETTYSVRDVEALAHTVHDINNVGASISSGSFRTAGMVIAPCSMKSMGGIAHSIGGDLLVRAADVILKERKKLVIVARETPLHLGHLESMVALTRMGAIIFPPVPAFYHRPKTLDDVINQTVTRILDQFDIDVTLFERWSDEQMGRHPGAERVVSVASRKEVRPAKKTK